MSRPPNPYSEALQSDRQGIPPPMTPTEANTILGRTHGPGSINGLPGFVLDALRTIANMQEETVPHIAGSDRIDGIHRNDSYTRYTTRWSRNNG